MSEKILIVEDDPAINEWLSYELEMDGYDITSVPDGPSGLTRAVAQPDLILLDVKLPGMNGFQVGRALRDDPRTMGIPIIFLTARTTMEDKLNGFEVGGTDYVTKPFKMAELKARVKAILQHRKIERQQAQAKLDAYQKNLSDNMNHELLTPMTILLSALDVMDNAVREEKSAEMGRVLNSAQTGANRLHWLIQDLLMVNNISQNQAPVFRQPIDFTRVSQSVLEQVSAQYERKELHIQATLPQCVVNMMQNQARDVLRHLLSNACKFSPAGGRVEFFIKPVGQGGVEVMVRNEGASIALDQYEHIFDKFYQIDMSITRPNDGLGLGLYIARTLARAYGGDVTVESEPAEDATFYFTLPDIPPEKIGEKHDHSS